MSRTPTAKLAYLTELEPGVVYVNIETPAKGFVTARLTKKQLDNLTVDAARYSTRFAPGAVE